MQPDPSFGHQQIVTELIRGVLDTVGSKPGLSPARRAAAVQTVVCSVMAFNPRDPVEAMMAGQCIVYDHMLRDGAAELLRGHSEEIMLKARPGVLACGKAFLTTAAMLLRMQRRAEKELAFGRPVPAPEQAEDQPVSAPGDTAEAPPIAAHADAPARGDSPAHAGPSARDARPASDGAPARGAAPAHEAAPAREDAPAHADRPVAAPSARVATPEPEHLAQAPAPSAPAPPGAAPPRAPPPGPAPATSASTSPAPSREPLSAFVPMTPESLPTAPAFRAREAARLLGFPGESEKDRATVAATMLADFHAAAAVAPEPGPAPPRKAQAAR